LPNFGFTSAIERDHAIRPSVGSSRSTRKSTGSLGAEPIPQVESDITPPIMPLGRPPLLVTAVVT